MARRTPPINGQVLYEVRLELGLTQLEVTALCKKAGYKVADSNISKLERGIIPRPTPRTRAVLLKVLKLTPGRMYAPCGTCGGDWTAACIEHPAGEQREASEVAA